MAWQRFRVTLKGEDPVEVQTNAFDVVDLRMDPNNPRPFDFMFHQVHNALVRTGHDNVPRDFKGFMEVLDGMPEAVDGDPTGLDPTQPDR